MLLFQQSNLLIQAVKTIDNAVIKIEVFKLWQCLKVHDMSLNRYLGPEKIGLLKREGEFSTGILLKATPHKLINNNRL